MLLCEKQTIKNNNVFIKNWQNWHEFTWFTKSHNPVSFNLGHINNLFNSSVFFLPVTVDYFVLSYIGVF